MASRYLDCIKKIAEATQNKIPEEKIPELLDEVVDWAQTQKAKGKIADMDAELTKFIKDFGNELEIQAAVKARSRILNKIAKQKASEFLGEFSNKDVGLKAFIAGSVRMITGARKSIDTQQKSLSDGYQKILVKLMEEEGVWDIFIGGKIERQIMEELFELKPGGKPGKSGSKNAEKIARLIHQMQVKAVDNANLAGGWISRLPGYIMRQSHNMLKIKRAGFQPWFNHISARLDMEKTAGHLPAEKHKEFFMSIYNALSDGVHLKYTEDLGAIDPVSHLGMPGSMAKRISQHRLLHFKDGKSFMEYNTEFGTNSLQENIFNSLDHMAKATVLMNSLGTNPEAMLRTIIKDQISALKKAQLKSKSKKEIDKLGKQINVLGKHMTKKNTFLWNLYSEVDGSAKIPTNVTAAQISGGWMAIQNMAKLGGATISSFADIANKAAELRFQGFGFFDRWGKVMTDVFKGRGAAGTERRLVSQMVGVGLDGQIGHMINRWSSIDMMPGTISKASQKFFKWNLMNFWNDSHRAGVAQSMSFHLGNLRNKSFSALDNDTQRILKMYGIEDAEWEMIKRATWKHKETGNVYITTDAVANLDDEIVKSYIKMKEGIKKVSKSRINRTKLDMQLAIGSYFVDRADFAIPMPGAWERAFMHLGTDPGSAPGIALRLLWQFKSFPLTVTRRAMGRELYGKGKADIFGLAQFIATTAVMGYVSMATKDILKGREPRKFWEGDYTHKAKVILAAMTQGGGLGIYGDFLFGEYNRFGGGWLKTAAGPTIGQSGDLAAIFSKAIRGESEATNLAAQLGKMVMVNTPFINLFYTKMMLDYLILYNIQEMANPGYVKRMEKRLKKKQNQRFYIPPSRVIPRGGTDPITAGQNLIEELGK